MDVLKSRGAGNPLKCIQCGSCTSACIVNFFDGSFNPRRIVGSLAKFGKPPRQNIWLCSTCSLCVDRCPQNVNPFSIILVLRSLDVNNGVPEQVSTMVKRVRETGLAFSLSKDIVERRRLLGLPEAKVSGKGLEEVRKILSEAGLE